MRIKSFEVSGFTHFTRPVRMGPLDEVNVIYGANNAGKSNLLRAIELYCYVLGAGEVVTKAQAQVLDEPAKRLAELLAAGQNWAEPLPVALSVEWHISKAELEKCGLVPERGCSRVTTTFQLNPARNWDLRVQRFMLENDDIALKDRGKDGPEVVFGQQVRRVLADTRPFQFEHPVLPFTRIGRHGEGFPQSLRDTLFDARQSRAPEGRRRWALFAQLAGSLRGELGEGAWETVYERSSGKADVVYLRDGEALTLEQMGDGIQRLAGLTAELCLAPERIVAAEEPEWRLSPELQKRLVQIAKRVIHAGLGPTQVFFTTHSPTIAALGRPFALEQENGVPTLTEKPWEAAGVTLTLADAEDATLGGLIGLVETLAEIDPEKLVVPQPAAAGAGWRR